MMMKIMMTKIIMMMLMVMMMKASMKIPKLSIVYDKALKN